MERRGIAEIAGAALTSGAVATVALAIVVGAIDWLLVLGVGMMAAIAAAANYRARRAHSEAVADEAPER